jgi:hypothetical protein
MADTVRQRKTFVYSGDVDRPEDEILVLDEQGAIPSINAHNSNLP